MAFVTVTADELNIYAITGDGSLLWYRDTLRNGTNGPNAQRGWAPRSGSQVDSGWDQFSIVFAGGNGILYAIRESGELLWYQDTLRDGSNGAAGTRGWAPRSGSQIGSGWNVFQTVFYGGAGVIYAIKETGELLWYRDTARDGSNAGRPDHGWAAGSGSQIGAGWGNFSSVFSGGQGVIYAVRSDGSLLWYRDLLQNGSNGPHAERGWAPRSASPIGVGWDKLQASFSPGTGDGVMYGVAATSDLLWYRDDVRNGSNGPNAERGWAAGSDSPIGVGWGIEERVSLAGYPMPLSLAPGDSVQIAMRAQRATPCTLQLYRLRENADGSVGVPVGAPVACDVTPQPTPATAWQTGCGWPPAASFTIDPSCQSGLYSARCTTQDGQDSTDVVFVVRPGAARKNLLLIANTNCWNAYNTWGGVSNYSGYAVPVTLTFERPNPGTAPDARAAGGYARNHLTAAEVWLSTWLEDSGFEFDVCSDQDFHNGNPDPTTYKAVILSTHPEYWSQQMAQRLSDYLAGGGRVLYWGGNGVFRQVNFAADGRSMTTGSSSAWYCGNAWPGGPKTRELLGVAYDIGHDELYPQSCGYVVVQPGHPVFAGTGLNAGDVVGTQGRNGGGACGWEVDTATDFGEGNGAQPDGLQVLAHGQLTTAAGFTGNITYYANAAGGFAFSIGSITFGGSLVMDAQLQQIARNALAMCLA